MSFMKKVPARFFRNASDREPVREWLLSLSDQERKIIGSDIATLEFGWPIGMPLCRSISSVSGLWEIRSQLPGRNIARILFCVNNGELILLNGFVKKSQKTPDHEIDLAEKRMKGL